MAVRVEDVIIRITSETKGVQKTTDILVEQGKVEKRNVKIFEETAKKRQFLIDANIKRLEKLQKQRKEAFNPQDIRRFDELIVRTTKDIKVLGGEVEKVDDKSGGLGKTLGTLGKIIAGAFAVSKLIDFTKHLFEVASESEAFEKRARTVFGNSIKIVEKFAEESARSLGLTEIGFLGAAAAIGDILVPLGLSRERAAEMSVEAVKLGGALKEFTGDSRSAAEISNIVARSLTGEVEGLKTLGVVIDQTSIQFKDLVKSKQVDLGLTQQQAKAEAIFQIAIESSGDALKSFETNTDSLARQEAELTAILAEQTEHLAELLTPAFLKALKGINSFSKTTKDLLKETIEQNKAFVTQSKEVNALVDRYEELTSQTDLNSDEQAELRDIIEDLTDRVPEAATEFDKFGVALGLNTEIIKENLVQQKELLVLRNIDRIEKAREEIKRFTAEVNFNTKTLNKGTKTIEELGGKTAIATREIKLTADEFRNIRNESKVFNAEIADLLLGIEELGIELTDVEKAFIDAALGTDRFKESVEDSSTVIKEQIRNVFFFKEEISKLRKEQAAQGTSLKRVSEITKELVPLQKELNDLLGKQTKDSNDLKEAIAALRKEFELSEDQIFGVTEALSKFDQEIERAQALGLNLSDTFAGDTEEFVEDADFLVAKFKESLEGREQALNISLKNGVISEAEFKDEISKLRDEALEEEEERIAKLRDKRLEAISIVQAAEQQAFSVLTGINDRRLTLIDNEQIAEERKLEAKFEQGRLTEEMLAESQLKIQTEADKKRAEILTKQAKQDKIAAIIQATINTAVAVTQALPNLLLSAFVALLGAAEVVTIATQPIPTFHEGKKPELKPGEINAVILKSESIIPPKQSAQNKGLIDAVIDDNLNEYVFKHYQLPLLKEQSNNPTIFDDYGIVRKQRDQIRLTKETNRLLRGLTMNNNRKSYGWD